MTNWEYYTTTVHVDGLTSLLNRRARYGWEFVQLAPYYIRLSDSWDEVSMYVVVLRRDKDSEHEQELSI